MRWLLPLLLVAPVAAAPAQAQADGRDAHQPSDAILRRDPRELPHAREGRWASWSPQEAPPPALLPVLQAGTRAYFAGDYGGAAGTFWALLEREPDFPPALYQLGVTYFRLRRYGDCAGVFERLLAVAPRALEATQALAHCYYSLGRYEDALAHYARVLAESPESVEALRGHALAHMRTGQLEAALELFDRCLELRPSHGDALYWKGQVLFDLGRLEEARAAAEAARALDAFDPRPHFLLSQVLYELGDDEGSAEAERRFGELDLVTRKVRTLEGLLLAEPRRGELYARLIDVHRASGNEDAVRETVRRLVRALPLDLGARALALRTLRELGHLEAAQRVADAVERDFAEVAEAWRMLRDHYGEVRDRVRQVRAGERYLRLGGDPQR